ncbi:MAG: peptidyl-prolyl cis-trans isomerase D [Methylophagaceae bacterium]|jgi:peptidyl-prolyl cis-trans isomerase D
MLHFIRERAQGWVAWFIVGLITIPFALWGVNSYITGESDVVVATVNGEPIKQAEFQRALQQFRDNMRQSMGDSFDPSVFDTAATKDSILQGLIQQRLLYSANQALGQQVTDSDISRAVQETAAFQVDGQFNLDRYKQLLSRAGFSPSSYESQLRMDILGRELTNNIQRSSVVTEQNINQLLRIERQKRELAYGIVESTPLAAGIEIIDADAKAFYDQHLSRYTTPEQLSVDYVELSVADLTEKVIIDDATLTQFYTDNKGQFMSSEQRRVSHILIEGDAEIALKILAAAEYRVTQGEAFDVIAKELSQDTGSASSGGDLGFMQSGMMGDAAFDDALFGLVKVGDVSQIVKTEYGHHLIQVTEIQAPEGKAFEDVKAEVETSYRGKEAQQLFFEQAELLAELSYENPDSLVLAAEELVLTIQSSIMFTRDGGEGIAENNKLVNIAFSDEVLLDDLNSAVIELSDTRLVVVHKKVHKLASQLPFDKVSNEIKAQLKLERAEQKATEIGQGLLTKIESGEVASLLFEVGQWHESAVIARGQTSINREVLEQAYAMKKPDEKKVYAGVSLNSGDYAIVILSTVIEGEVDLASDQDRASLSAYLARSSGDSELSAFMASLKADADIDISPNY